MTALTPPPVLPDPAAMTMAELRAYDLHYQHLVILKATEGASVETREVVAAGV